MHLQTHFVKHCGKILFTLIILILDIEIFYLIQENWSGQWWSWNELDILSKCNDKSWNSCSDKSWLRLWTKSWFILLFIIIREMWLITHDLHEACLSVSQHLSTFNDIGSLLFCRITVVGGTVYPIPIGKSSDRSLANPVHVSKFKVNPWLPPIHPLEWVCIWMLESV